jgi:hypothetical protein
VVQNNAGSPSAQQAPHRVRFAKAQLLRALSALEELQPDSLDEGIRRLELEDQLSEAREQAARWRRSYESIHALFTAHGSNPEVGRLDSLIREWVAKA